MTTPPDAAALEAAEVYAGKFTWTGIKDRIKDTFLYAVAWRDAHPKVAESTKDVAEASDATTSH